MKNVKPLKIIKVQLAILLFLIISPALLLNTLRFTRYFLIRISNIRSNKDAFFSKDSTKDGLHKLDRIHSQLPSEYKSFVVWKTKNFNSEFTTIQGPYNSRKSNSELIDGSVWFFGGSTIWGYGVSDSQTIPSQYNSLTGIPVYNFGELGWNSRQSLNQLISSLGDQYKPSLMVFYEGVNDVFYQCRKENKYLPSHSREIFLKNSINSPLSMIGKSTLRYIYEPYKIVINKFSLNPNWVKSSPNYDCHLNANKALTIAQHFVKNWHTAYLLADTNKVPFYGILQPTLFSTKTDFDYSNDAQGKKLYILKKQYEAVYPLIIEELKKECLMNKDFCNSIVDGTKWLISQNDVFIDFCHLNLKGNKIVAKQIADLLK